MKSSGFTLIELIVVIILLSILAGIVAPQFGSFYKKVKFDSTIRRVKNFFYYTEFLALKNKTFCKIKINQNENCFYAFINQQGRLVPIERKRGKLKLPLGIKIGQIRIDGHLSESPVVKFKIYPLFVPHQIDIQIKGFENKGVFIRIEAGGGMVEVVEEHGEK